MMDDKNHNISAEIIYLVDNEILGKIIFLV